MVANFPDFTPLELRHMSFVRSFTAKYPPYSDFNFISLYIWNTDGSTSISLLNDNLLIKQPDYVTGKEMLALLGDNDVDRSLKTLLDTTETLQMIPETTVNNVQNKSDFVISEDRDNHDYLYNLAELVELRGEKFKKIRNKLNNFKTACKDAVPKTLNSIDASQKQSFVELFDRWSQQSKQPVEDLKAERIAFMRTLDAANDLGLLFTVLELESEVIALHISELLPNNQAICHFEKALRDFDHASIAISYEGSKALEQRGVLFSNWEQDLGIDSIRQSKMKWQPTKFLKKYTITKK